MRRPIFNPIKSGAGRYTVLLVGLGAAGVAIGWIGPQRPRGHTDQLRPLS